jgi:hypothetical protein
MAGAVKQIRVLRDELLAEFKALSDDTSNSASESEVDAKKEMVIITKMIRLKMPRNTQ